ncbi:MAG: carbohydrate kinase family protein [Myxococcota bacterium]
MRIVVTGSLAYDYIMNFPGHFKEHILPDKVHMLTVSFLVDSMKRLRGGVAGNIAYTLALLGERPLVVATAGTDFGDYQKWMSDNGVDASGVVQIPDEFTASCFINTDMSNNQIVAFYAGAMAHAKELSLRSRGLTKGDLVLISPTAPEAIVRYAQECRELGVPYVFDPGKQTPRLSAEQILAGLSGAQVLIGNDYELGMMAKTTGRSEEALIAAAPLSVVTKGEEGSLIYSREGNGKPLHVRPAPVKAVIDPTGAGDAYLAGLAYGLAHDLPHEISGRIASVAAAFAIEQKGCQEHRFTRAEFARRYAEAYGPAKEVAALAAA